MKIAITASGPGAQAQVDPRFGRAAGFAVYDTESDEYDWVENAQNRNAMQGAGVQSAQTVSEMGVDCVITGHCGPKAFRGLQAAGIAVMTGAEGTVAQAVEAHRKGELEAIESPDVEGHWV